MGIGRNGSKHGRLGGQNTVERPFCAEAVGVGLKILAAKRLIHSKLQKVIVAKMNDYFLQIIEYKRLCCQP